LSVVVIGSVNRDYICQVPSIPRTGETVLATAIQLSNGGKGGNQAVACARLGVPTYLVSCVGRDADGENLLHDLVTAGVDTSEVLIVDVSHTGLAFVMVDRAGENSILVAPGANHRMDADVARTAVASRLRCGDVLVAQTEIPMPCVEAAIEEARRIGARVVLNLAPHVPISKAALGVCDPLVVNEGEARHLLGIDVDADIDPREMAARLAQEARSAVITVGARGALIARHDDIEHVPAEMVTVVDTTGAGDAFIGALAAALSQGSDLLTAVRRGVTVGTIAVTRAGTQDSYPTVGELVRS
jgi:ribokinase